MKDYPYITIVLAVLTPALVQAIDLEIPPLALTNVGPIQGTRIVHRSRSIDAYYGVPYAKPPLGELRFKRPVPITEPWDDVLVATEMALACPQHVPVVPYPWADELHGQSEDCLYLNMWMPSEPSSCGGGRPVLFWIHSGHFKLGSNRKPVYDSRALAAVGNVVVVTLNYRLGSLGFLYSGTDDAPGNAGLHDILLALQWVHDNIHAFGGNPNRITLIGEGSGAIAAGLLTMSPLSKGLYRRVIMQSGAPSHLAATDLAHSKKMSEQFARAMHCANNSVSLYSHPEDVINCLRSIDSEALMKPTNHEFSRLFETIMPTFGDDLLPADPQTMVTDGRFHNTELLIGVNQDEGSADLVGRFPHLFGYSGEKDPKINRTHGEALMRFLFHGFPDTDSLVEHYMGDLREKDYEEVREALYTALGDYLIVCPTVFFAERFADQGNGVFFYYFTHRPETTPWADWMGVTHFAEVQFVFGQPMVHPHLYEEEEIPLSRRMIKRWSMFAKTGNPGGMWPYFSSNHPKVRIFDPVRKVNTPLPSKVNCEFFKYFLNE